MLNLTVLKSFTTKEADVTRASVEGSMTQEMGRASDKSSKYDAGSPLHALLHVL